MKETREKLLLENEELRERLREAEEVLRAIRCGEVDALAISDAQGARIYTLEGADRAYRILVDTMNEGALTLSSDGTILYGNVRFETMLGAPLAKRVQTSIFDHVAPEDGKVLEALLHKAQAGSARGEIRLLAGEGKALPVRLSISALELGKAVGYCIVVSDLSEEKQVQEELRAYSARLEAMNRELKEFLFVASHDLQEPLRKIQTFYSRIKAAGSYDLLDDESRADLERMQKSAKRMQDLIRALLSYTRVFRNPGSFEVVDLNDLVREVLRELGSLIREAGAHVRAWNLPSLEVEPDQMSRLFRNLLENALKFHRDEPPAVKIYGEMRDGAARIFIEDNGMGLDEGYLDRIFKPFQQLHRRGAFEGTGIGLAVCRKIVEQHGGTITVESTPGMGSKFIVTLPLKQPSSEEPRVLPANALRERTKEDLLLDIYRLTERLKESEEVISAIRENRIDALVSYEAEGEKVYTLKSANEGYRLLVESINEGAVILSPDGSIYYSNSRFEQMLQREPQKITGSLMMEYVDPKDGEKFEILLRQAVAGRMVQGEIHLKGKNGALLPVYISLSPLNLEEFHGICLTLTDLTEQKLYIKRLEWSNQELRDFASIASHDLQEPLRKIRTFGERLKAKCADALSEEGLDYLERMQNASKRMQIFIQELLTYSQVSTRAEPFRTVDLKAILIDVLSDLQVRIDETGGRIEIGELPLLEGDPSQMRQLFQNLIGNALKFHGEKSPLVKVHGWTIDAAEEYSAESPAAGPRCRILVEDNGIGFDERNAERIFAPFQRLHGRSAFEGTGMGLAICRKIVERHGGVITAKSTPGRGSTFMITLPLVSHQGEAS